MKFNKDIVVIDLETTGFSPVSCEITEVGVVRLDGLTLQVKEEYNPLIKIDGFVPKKVQELTGITNKMLQTEGLPKEEVKREVLRLAQDAIVVAHNAPFDFSFLKWHFDLEPKFFYDTLTLSRMLEPQHSSHKLGDICKRINYDLTNAHRAIHDVYATVEVLKYLLSLDSEARLTYINSIHGGRGVKYKPEHTKEIIK